MIDDLAKGTRVDLRVAELYGKPSIKGMRHHPQKHFCDPEGHEQIISGVGNRVRLVGVCKRIFPDGATVIPLILGSDKTQLSVFTGDKSAMASISHHWQYPEGEDRRCPRKRTQFLLGYLPVTKLKIFGSKKTQQVEQYRLFHRCMRILLGRLYDLKERRADGNCMWRLTHQTLPICSFSRTSPIIPNSASSPAAKRVGVQLATSRQTIVDERLPARPKTQRT